MENHRKGKRVLIALLLIIFTASLEAPFMAHAAGVKEKQEQLKKVKQQLAEKKRKLAATKSKQKSVVRNLEKIQLQLNRTESEIQRLGSKLAATHAQVQTTQKELEVAIQNLNKQTQIMDERLVNIYENGRVSYLDVLLNASSFSDFLNRMVLVKKVAAQDIQIFQQIKAQKHEIEVKKAFLQQKEREIASLQRQQQNQKEQYRASAMQQRNMLSVISRERDQLEAAIDEEERMSKELESTIQQLLRKNGDTGTTYKGGAMLCPANGPITSPFGWRVHPILHKKKYHSGVDIGAAYGSNILAPADGKVIYSGWVNGYGNTLIIDHGGGITTLFGHTSKLLAGVGEKVTRGQVVAKVGSTGFSTGPHLHFEVRKNGIPVNPMNYI